MVSGVAYHPINSLAVNKSEKEVWLCEDVFDILHLSFEWRTLPDTIRELCRSIPEEMKSEDIELLATSGRVVVRVEPSKQSTLITGTLLFIS